MLILASTSPYRRQLLARLGLPFEVMRPDVDETPLSDELPAALSRRLSDHKAWAVARRFPDAWVIGSDQVAELHGQALGKPGNFERAAGQLAACSGQRVRFHTAASLVHMASDRTLRIGDLTQVQFRQLTSAEIERYLHAEQPYDCAGSFKVEGLGASLFESVDSRDPTALIGLPLIALAQALREVGFQVP